MAQNFPVEKALAFISFANELFLLRQMLHVFSTIYTKSVFVFFHSGSPPQEDLFSQILSE